MLEQENKVVKMREATPEERESISKYINNISTLTGVSFENLEQESCDDMVSRGVFEQVKWERDVAIEQLKELGYVLGQKIEHCDDCISRSKVLEGKVIHQSCDGVEIINGYAVPVEYIEQLPPVTPKPDVLDKIRAEIEQLTSRYSISKERGGMGQVEWSDKLIKENDVLQIIDKYKVKSEE